MSLRNAFGVPSTQVPICLTTLVSHIAPLAASYVIMAVLAITPKTRVFRIALWPIVALLTWRATFVDWSRGKHDLIFVNAGFIRLVMCVPVYTLSWTLAGKPLVRYLRPANSSPSTIMDALDLVVNLRGVGWDWSRGLYIPPETRPTNRVAFALHALLSTITESMTCTASIQVIHTLTAGTGSKTQPTIYDETLPVLVRYFRSTIITAMAGVVAYSSLLTTYNLLTALGVLLLGQDPAQWPPGLERPWRATSLTEFWGRRWHQWYRHTFVLCAHPFAVVFGRPGRTVGVFLVSGFAHHLFLIPYDDGRSEVWRMFLGFGMMAPGILAERAFYKVTGRKVGGVVGWIWMVTWLAVWCSFVVEGFVRAGIYSLPREVRAWGWVEDLVQRFDAWLHTL